MGLFDKFFGKKEKTEELIIKVAGVTFKNGRKSRQTILRKIKYKDKPFDNRLDIKMEQYDFEGRPAIGIYVNGEMIGNVPKDKTQFLVDNADRMIGITGLEIVGGGTVNGEELSYGARIKITLKAS